MSVLGFLGLKDDRINYGEIAIIKLFKVVEFDHFKRTEIDAFKIKGK